jgi:flagellar assembly protein FliH
LSKEFLPAFSSQAKALEASYEMEWPELQPKTYVPSLQGCLKELEEKALKQTREKALFIEKEAFEKGYAQGEKDGLELGKRRIETTAQQLLHVLREIAGQRDGLYRAFEKEMLQLTFSIARKVIHHEVMMREEIISGVLREAFRQVADRRKVTVHVHPIDHHYLMTHPDHIPFASGEEGIKVIEDPSVTRGGCLLETSLGAIDATLESQVDEIVSLVWEEWKRSRPSSEGAGP